MNNKAAGKMGEYLAEKFLINKGYKILEKNWTCRWGEIDIITEKDGILVFVEVKYRKGIKNGHPFESINYYKKKSLQRSINIYLTKNYVIKPWRLDVICINKESSELSIDHYEYVPLNYCLF